ncbi:Hypothetical predicted protein [Mytilus galloprovincialis]|uniref:B box-type domain-containing protein n=1 Tax=Mytilus galloprovincialis TaxID=29158 RepID=A0A8B6CQN3_MYTGA|nr:Hypothetical predicted protein [Mytilus galloprovincialis]
MALSSEKICGSCDVQHITEADIVWCTTCDEGLCSTCLGHQARHAKKSVNMLDIERGFGEIGKTLEKLQHNRQQNIDTIKDDKKTISITIRALKERLTKRLDEMEAKILTALDTNVSINLSELNQLVSKVQEKKQSLEHTRKTIKQVKEGLSDVQVFLFTKDLKAKLR